VLDCYFLIFVTSLVLNSQRFTPYISEVLNSQKITPYISVDTKNYSINPQHIATHASRFLCFKTEMAPFQGINRENHSPVEPCSKNGSSSSGECV
jgi:hypothetical protein